jgi:hypothetical protein
MRQRIKRRVFLMSMALATGASGSALAKGSKHDREEWAGFSGSSGPARSDLLATLQGWVGGLGYSAETEAEAQKGWRLEMLPARESPAASDNGRPSRDRAFGLAVRLAF